MPPTLRSMPVVRARPALGALALLSLLDLCAGCGSESGGAGGGDPVRAGQASVRDDVAAARTVDPATFPKPPSGMSVEQFAGRFAADGPQAVAASSVLRTPENRVAFGLLHAQQRFV